MDLQIAKCCSSCINSNKPRKQENHIPYCTTAKTERWCYKNQCMVTRESTCENYEIESKKGAIPAYKRILSFNRRLEWFKEIVKWMQDNNIEFLQSEDKRYTVLEDKLCRGHYSYRSEQYQYYVLSCKSNHEDEYLKKAIENYKNKVD
jgi:hypothetical protein